MKQLQVWVNLLSVIDSSGAQTLITKRKNTHVQAWVVRHPSRALAQRDVLLLPLLAEAFVALLVQNALTGWTVASGTNFRLIRALRATSGSDLFSFLARSEKIRASAIFPRRCRRRTRRRSLLVVGVVFV